MFRIGLGVGRPLPSFGAFDSDAQAFLSAAGITDATQQAAINTLVVDLKADGLWSKMKAIYPFVGGTASTHKYNLKDPRDLDAAFRLVFNGGWTHSSTGATPNGTNGYADTKLSPSSVLAQNSTHASFYSRTNISTANQIDFGASAALTKCYAYLNDGGLTYFRINHFTTESSTSVGGSSQKNYIFNRTNSTTESVFLNSTKTSFTKASNGIPNVNMYLGATNNQGSAALFASKQCAMFTIGDGLTDTEAANFYTAVQAYQTALSRQV